MSKRFTDTGKWEKPWFRKLSPAEKAAWQYITDRCDNVGVWDADYELADFIIGESIDWAGFADRCNGNIKKLDNGKWWLVDYCTFQHPDLSEDSKSNAIQSYVQLLKKHGLFEGYVKGSPTLHIPSWERERERERVEEKETPNLKEDADAVITHLNETAGSHFKAIDSNRKGIIARLNDGYTVDDCKSVIVTKCAEWLDTDMAKHLNPETLFRPSKFEKYLNQAKIADAPYDDGLRPYKAAQ